MSGTLISDDKGELQRPIAVLGGRGEATAYRIEGGLDIGDGKYQFVYYVLGFENGKVLMKEGIYWGMN